MQYGIIIKVRNLKEKTLMNIKDKLVKKSNFNKFTPVTSLYFFTHKNLKKVLTFEFESSTIEFVLY